MTSKAATYRQMAGWNPQAQKAAYPQLPYTDPDLIAYEIRDYLTEVTKRLSKNLPLSLREWETCKEAHIEVALWASHYETPEGEYLKLEDFEPAELLSACLDFDLVIFLTRVNQEGLLENAIDAQSIEHIAHDFWLTRHHHGAGFWDGDYLPSSLGDRLTEISQEFDELYLTIDPDETGSYDEIYVTL